MFVDVLPAQCGGMDVFASTEDASALPVRLAHFHRPDTVFLLLYTMENGPGVDQLLARAPEVIETLNDHFGEQRH